MFPTLRSTDPRYLVKTHQAKLRGSSIGHGDENPLVPDEQRLYSVYTPSLTAGTRDITVTQDVTAPDGQQFTLSETQTFKVVAPRFTLPPADILSIYPPANAQVPVKVLPHIVFRDPHLPWERSMNSTSSSTTDRARIPWLALWVFRPDELMFPHNVKILQQKKLSKTGSVRLMCSDVINAGNPDTGKPEIVTPLRHHNGESDEEGNDADFIFVKKDIFQAFTQTYGSNGSSSLTCDCSPYGYQAHVRKVGSDTLTAAAVAMDQDCYSVIIANRTGPLKSQGSLDAIAHLVSLEGLDSRFSLKDTDAFVTMCSLYSWTFSYTRQDAQAEFGKLLQKIGTPLSGVEFLRPNAEKYASLIASGDAARQRAGRRIRDGYALTRYRLLSGEETLALQRGPLIPMASQTNAALNESIHLFPSQLQILDATLGLMDNSYASAWNLGKTNALADEKFTNALVRIRTSLHGRAQMKAKAEVLSRKEDLQEVIKRLKSDTSSLLKLGDAKQTSKSRWMSSISSDPDPSLSLWGTAFRTAFTNTVAEEASELSQSQSGNLYNEENNPGSSDWATILAWLLDALYLSNIPWHYLVTDSTSLPKDSIRFFYIDHSWLNAYLDGALSIGNHVEGDQDSIRIAIKSELQKFLAQNLPSSTQPPQIPLSGFLIRSSVIADIPNLGVKAPRAIGDARASVLRQINLAPDILLVLLDRPFTSTDFPLGIKIIQPPHQQCFVASNGELSNDKIEILYRNITTQGSHDKNKPMEQIGQPVSEDRKPLINDRGILLSKNLVQKVYDFLTKRKGSTFVESAPSSALLALHLSYALSELVLLFPPPGSAEVIRPFRLTMLKTQSLYDVGQGYQKREKNAEAALPNRGPDRKAEAPFDTENDVRTLPRAPYWTRISALNDETGSGRPTEDRSLVIPAPTENQYVLQVYALGFKAFYDISGAPTQIPHVSKPLSLVFGLQNIRKAAQTSYFLRLVSIVIPSSPSGSSDGLLLGYSGPGASMATNIRFIPNVMASLSTNAPGSSSVIVNLSPRSKVPLSISPKSCATTSNPELTFILRQVLVNATSNTLNSVFKITVNEYYGDSQIPLTSTAQVKLVNPSNI